MEKSDKQLSDFFLFYILKRLAFIKYKRYLCGIFLITTQKELHLLCKLN